ncbi:MAG TPA: pitrilysin family protein [Gemmatimonadaceae bacterium]|nr:pitrilysin family protein [Gemmatimonadaceae bacterium]
MRLTVSRRLIASAALVMPAMLGAQSTPQVKISYVTDSLPNGLHVIYSIDHSTPVAAVMMMYNVASKSERAGKTGFAHLFEHMMFKGSRDVADGQHFALLERVGGRGGADINGTTSWDRTNYFEQVPSNQLDLALWLEADRMGTLLETVTQAKLDNQREVVKNERRQSVDNQPYGVWIEKLQSYVYPAGHPYHHPVVGSMEDLTNASLDDVQTFFKTYYAPNNAVLVIAGDIDLAEAKALVRKRFSWIPRGPAVPARPSMAVGPVIGSEKREVIQDPNASAPAVFVAYRMPPARSADGPAVDLLADIIAGGQASPLYKSLVRTKQAAVNVQGFNFGLVDGADMLVIIANGKPGSNPDSLERALVAELDNVSSLISQPLLERSRATSRFNFVNGLQTTGGFGGRADQLAEGFTYYNDPNHVNKVLGNYDAVTVAQLKRLVAARLTPANRVRLVFVPAPKPAAKTTSGGGDR